MQLLFSDEQPKIPRPASYAKARVYNLKTALPEMSVDNRLDKLTDRVDELISLVRKLKRENSGLQAREAELTAQTDALREKNFEAKKRLDSIISRLRQNGEQI